MTSTRRKGGLIVLGVAAVFGVLGLIGAAYGAHLVLHTPGGPQTTAGPAWLFTGLGMGAVVGTSLAMAARRLIQRHPH